MILATGNTYTYYEVTDRNNGEEHTYEYSSLKCAMKSIREALVVFEEDASLISCYERTYDEFGNLKEEDKCF